MVQYTTLELTWKDIGKFHKFHTSSYILEFSIAIAMLVFGQHYPHVFCRHIPYRGDAHGTTRSHGTYAHATNAACDAWNAWNATLSYAAQSCVLAAPIFLENMLGVGFGEFVSYCSWGKLV